MVLKDPSIVSFEHRFIDLIIDHHCRRRFMVAAGDSGDHMVSHHYQSVRLFKARRMQPLNHSRMHGIIEGKINTVRAS